MTLPGAQYQSSTSPSSQGVKGNDSVTWNIVGAVLPVSAEVELRFNSSKVVSAYTLSDGATRQISAKIKNKGLKKGDSFPYKVWFVDGNTEYCMEDPELVMDGDTPIVVPRKKKVDRQKVATKKKPIRKKKVKQR